MTTQRVDNGPIRVLTAVEVAKALRLIEDHTAEGDAVAAVQRLVRECGLRPIKGCGKSYKFAEPEIARWVMASTEEFEPKGSKAP